MTKFKVGDRVRLKYVNTYERWGAKGEEGTVIVADDRDDDCRVRFDVAGEWFARWGILEPVAVAPATATLTIEAGKYYKTRDGRKVGPMEHWNVYDGQFFHAPEGNFYGEYWQENGVNGEPHIGQDDSLDLIAEWADEPAAVAGATAAFKVGDRVRLTERNTHDRWGAKDEEGTVLIGGGGALDCHVDFDVAGRWYASWDILDLVAAVPPTTIKVGDWVRTDNGDIGIVLHDDGTGDLQFKVGFVGDDNDEHWDWFSDLQLTVVPPGTTKAGNDNAPILAEIDELEQRLGDLRAKLAA